MKVAFILTSHMGALKFIGEAMVDCDRAIDAFNDFTQTDFGRGAVEFIASGYANRVICLVCNSQLVPSFLSWNNYSIALFRTNVNRLLSK